MLFALFLLRNTCITVGLKTTGNTLFTRDRSLRILVTISLSFTPREQVLELVGHLLLNPNIIVRPTIP